LLHVCHSSRHWWLHELLQGWGLRDDWGSGSDGSTELLQGWGLRDDWGSGSDGWLHELLQGWGLRDDWGSGSDGSTESANDCLLRNVAQASNHWKC